MSFYPCVSLCRQDHHHRTHAVLWWCDTYSWGGAPRWHGNGLPRPGAGERSVLRESCYIIIILYCSEPHFTITIATLLTTVIIITITIFQASPSHLQPSPCPGLSTASTLWTRLATWTSLWRWNAHWGCWMVLWPYWMHRQVREGDREDWWQGVLFRSFMYLSLPSFHCLEQVSSAVF